MKNCGSNYAKSDSRSKEEIRRLQSANDALTAALKSARPEYPTPKAPDSDSLGTGELDGAAMAASQGNLPPTEYPKLPSRTNFADTPAANKVAAQNVGLQATAPETTQLAPGEESQFRNWARNQNVTDVDHPDSHYDYRGFWKANPRANIRGGRDHFPDTYKQHGHPTFSTESQYSKSFSDGGYWEGEKFNPSAAPELKHPDLSALDEAYRRMGRGG